MLSLIIYVHKNTNICRHTLIAQYPYLIWNNLKRIMFDERLSNIIFESDKYSTLDVYDIMQVTN